jgi:hypothetical protein
MPENTTNINVAAATWVKAADGPIEAQLTGTDNFEYVFAPTDTAPDPDFRGHFVFANRQEVVIPVATQSVWVRNDLRPMTIAVTTSAV